MTRQEPRQPFHRALNLCCWIIQNRQNTLAELNQQLGAPGKEFWNPFLENIPQIKRKSMRRSQHRPEMLKEMRDGCPVFINLHTCQDEPGCDNCRPADKREQRATYNTEHCGNRTEAGECRSYQERCAADNQQRGGY